LKEYRIKRNRNKKKPTKKALATPVARAMAKDLGVDIDKIRPEQVEE